VRALWLAGLLLLGGIARAHAGDFEIEELRIVRTAEGVFLEGLVVYPAWDDPLSLEVVATDRGEGVLELREGSAWRPVPSVPIPYGVTSLGATTAFRIRLTGGPYPPGEEVPVTFLFPAGALLTVRATVEGRPRVFWVFGSLALAAALGILTYTVRKLVLRTGSA